VKKLAQELIDGRVRLYDELQDPLRLWEIYFLARAGGLEIPPCVSSYLDRVSRRLTERSVALSEGRAPRGTIEQALELHGRGRGSVVAKRAALRRQQQLVVDVIEVMAKGHRQTRAIDLCLEQLEHSSPSAVDRRTVERAVREYKRKGWRAAGGRGGGLPPEPSAWTRQIKAR